MAKTHKFTLLLFCFINLSLAHPRPAHAQLPWANINPSCYYEHEGDQVATIQGLECLVANLLTVAITLIGLAVLVMFIIGSYQLIISGGDPKAVAAAKQTFTFAILGLVVALLGWFILNTIATLTGAEQIKTFSTQVNDTSSSPTCGGETFGSCPTGQTCVSTYNSPGVFLYHCE